MITHPTKMTCESNLKNNQQEQILLKHALWPSKKKAHRSEEFHKKRRQSVLASGGTIHTKDITHEEEHALQIEKKRKTENSHDTYVQKSMTQFKSNATVQEPFVLIVHCSNIWELEGVHLEGHQSSDRMIPTMITMLQMKLLATSLAKGHSGRCVYHLPMGESLPCAVVLLFSTVKNACEYVVDILSKWEALLTNPDPNVKVTNILKDQGYVRSLVAQLHPKRLPTMECVLGKGKSWIAPGGHGIIGEAFSETMAVAYHARSRNINHIRTLTRTRPRERLEYIVCDSAVSCFFLFVFSFFFSYFFF